MGTPRRFGWKPIILTGKSSSKPDSQFDIIDMQPDDILIKWKNRFGFKLDETVKDQFGLPIYKDRNAIVDFILNLWPEIFAYPDLQKGWRKHAVEVGKKLLQKESIDDIISSSSPVTSHLIAKDLKSEYRIPWVADLRDLWTQNHFYQYSNLRRLIERKLELKTLSAADALVTVSQPLAKKLKRLHKGKKVYSIPNGFDPGEKGLKVPLKDSFTMTYTGHVYRRKQDPALLFKALQELFSEKVADSQDVIVDFYGRGYNWLGEDIKKYALQDVVKLHGSISRDKVLKKQRESQILLLLGWNDPQELGIYSGKIFEYLAAQRPILSIGGYKDVVSNLLDETKAGIFINSEEELKSFLVSSFCEWKQKGEVAYNGKIS